MEPSYTAIAERYKKEAATVKKLAQKVITGGSGAWGEFVMSAHPQLSLDQASEIVSYILSVNDQTQVTHPVPPVGTIDPGKNKKGEDKGEYILSVTYQDKESMGVEPNLVKKNFHFRYPQLKAVASSNDSAVANLSESVVRFSGTGSWIMFRNIDLTDISSVQYRVDQTQIGGQLSLHLDSPHGKQVASVNVEQFKKPQKTNAKGYFWQVVSSKVLPENGIHDLYFVYHDPKNAQSSMWTTLYLDWIEFKK
jgi:cytochrome c